MHRPDCDAREKAGWQVRAKFRPEGPWELSPGFNLGNRVLSSIRSEGPAERENVDGIENWESSWLRNRLIPAFAGELRVSHRSFRPGALLDGQPRLKPGLSFQDPSGRDCVTQNAEPAKNSLTIRAAYPAQLRGQRLRLNDRQFTSEVATDVGSRAPIDQIHAAQLRNLLGKPLFSS
jgi:hypothetical protein